MDISNGSSRSGAFSTQRKDWENMVVELFSRVVDGVPFGIGVVAKEKTLLGSTLRYRMNNGFPNKSISVFIRKNFSGAALDKMFQSDQGLDRGPVSGVYRVVGDKMGLPKNCLVVRVENPEDKNQRAVAVFGGERMAGHLERRMEGLGGIISGAGASKQGVGGSLESADQLLKALTKLNVKRLFDYDLSLLSRIVNGLEEIKEDLPRDLKPKFKAASDYVIKKRVKR